MTVANSTVSPKKLAFLHRTNEPFVNSYFFGQEFVVGSLTANSRRSVNNVENMVFFRTSPLSENGQLRKQQTIATERYNASLVPSFSTEPPARAMEMFLAVKRLVKDDRLVTCDFHYPMRDGAIIMELHRLLVENGMRDQVRLVGHQHMLADFGVSKIGEPTTSNGRDGLLKSIRKFANLSTILDAIVAVSNAVRDSCITYVARDSCALRELQPEKIVVIPNGIDPGIYVPRSDAEKSDLQRQLGLADGLRKVICFVGRLDKIKGIDTLVKVLEHFDKSHSRRERDLGFVIATSDVLHPDYDDDKIQSFAKIMELKRLIREKRLRLVVDISKFTRGDPRFTSDVVSLLTSSATSGFTEVRKSPIYGGMVGFPVQGAADINLVPSTSEAFSLSTVEGIYSGCFAIANNVGGLREVVANHYLGMVINTNGNIDEAAEAFVDATLSVSWNGRLRKMKEKLLTNRAYFDRYTDIDMYARYEELALTLHGASGG